MNGITFGQLSEIFIILVLLFTGSCFFNRYIEKAGLNAEGQSWKLVVIGVFYTQVAIGLLDMILPWNAFFIGMLAYIASGSPMAYGARLRHQDMLRRAHQAARE